MQAATKVWPSWFGNLLDINRGLIRCHRLSESGRQIRSHRAAARPFEFALVGLGERNTHVISAPPRQNFPDRSRYPSAEALLLRLPPRVLACHSVCLEILFAEVPGLLEEAAQLRGQSPRTVQASNEAGREHPQILQSSANKVISYSKPMRFLHGPCEVNLLQRLGSAKIGRHRATGFRVLRESTHLDSQMQYQSNSSLLLEAAHWRQTFHHHDLLRKVKDVSEPH